MTAARDRCTACGKLHDEPEQEGVSELESQAYIMLGEFAAFLSVADIPAKVEGEIDVAGWQRLVSEFIDYKAGEDVPDAADVLESADSAEVQTPVEEANYGGTAPSEPLSDIDQTIADMKTDPPKTSEGEGASS